MKLLPELFTQIQDIDPVDAKLDDPSEVTDDMTVVGTLSDDAKRLWVFLGQTTDRANEVAKQARGEERGSDKYEELYKQIQELKLRHELINRLFWDGLRLEFPELIGKCDVGMAQDFQVYWKTCSCHSGIMGLEIITVSGGGSLGEAINSFFNR
jgi:hypothetical protein